VYDAAMPRFTTTVCEDLQPTADQVACFSNSAFFLSLLAPGAVIEFAGLSGAGTSVAAPHVSGAVTALRTQNRYRDPTDCTLARLVKSGDLITDHRNGLRFPRVNLGAATATWSNSIGDCDANGRVESGELETGIAIALGGRALSDCPSFDASQNGAVTIDELVSATNVALFGCAVGASGLV
jgi:hypothetical protein